MSPGPLKINTEIDRLSKKLAVMRLVQKSFPDTKLVYQGLGGDGPDYLYESPSINSHVDNIFFRVEKNWVYAYCFKAIETINVYSDPGRFGILQYYPDSLFKDLILQNYRENMLRANISNELIRKADLWVIDFISKKNISIEKSNINDGSFEDLKRLLLIK